MPLATISATERQVSVAAMALLCAVAFLVRIEGLADTGVLDDDAIYYTIFGDYYRKLLFEGYPPYFALDIAYKPAFLALSTLMSAIYGYTDHTLPLLNAFLGTGVVWATWRVARHIDLDPWFALLCAAAIAFNPFFIRLDRLGISHTGATLALLLSIDQLLIWMRFRWLGSRRAADRSALLLGCAFLFHPTILLFCLAIGIAVTAQALRQTALPIGERFLTILRYAGIAALPLVAVDILYRLIFLVAPIMIGGTRLPLVAGYGYLSDVVGAFLMASRSGEGGNDPLFIWRGLGLLLPSGAFFIALPIVAGGVAVALWPRLGRARLTAMAFIALFPLSMMAFNPYVGQYDRALHATVPILSVFAAFGVYIAAARLGRWAPRRSMPALAAAVALTGIIAFWHRDQLEFRSAEFKMDEMGLPNTVLGSLKANNEDKVYIYYSGFYGIHWFYYMNVYFGALPFVLDNPKVMPKPDYRMIGTIDELAHRLDGGEAKVVLMRRMPDWIAALWGGRAKEEAFLAEASRRGAYRIEALNDGRRLPDHLYVYDFAARR